MSTTAEKPEAHVEFVDDGYFGVLHIPLAQGRLWEHTEIMRGALLVVINQTMARQLWPNGDAIGHQIKIAALKDQPPYTRTAAGSDSWMQRRVSTEKRACVDCLVFTDHWSNPPRSPCS